MAHIAYMSLKVVGCWAKWYNVLKLSFTQSFLRKPNATARVSLEWSATNSCFTIYAILLPYSINSI